MTTVLVVDDVHRVLSVAVKILKDANYNVLLAESGANAIDLAGNYTGNIDLLLSDVPGMTGPDLGEALKKAMVLKTFELTVRRRPPYTRPEDHEHKLEGLRKAGWQG